MCENCDKVYKAFIKATSHPQEEFNVVFVLLLKMINSGELEIYAGDCAFEDMVSVLEEEKHYTVAFYLKCPFCQSYYFFGDCIRGLPKYKKVKDISVCNIDKMIWGKKGSYFDQGN